MEQEIKSAVVGDERSHKVREIDFRRPMKFTREQIRSLEYAHDSFCRSASNRLSAEMRAEVEIRFTASAHLSYSVIVNDELPQHAFMMVLEADPIGTKFAIVVDIPSVLSMTNRLLGGSAAEKYENRELTELEMAVAKRSLASLVENLSNTWTDLCGLSFKASDSETSPAALPLVPASEPTLLLAFSVVFDEEVEGTIALIVPWNSMEPVIDHISRAHQDLTEDTAGSGAVARALGKVGVEIHAEAGSMEMPLGELLSYKPGDTILFPQNASNGVDVVVGGTPLYNGQPGTHDGHRAVQVTARIDKA